MRNLLSQLLAVGPELAAYILTAPLLARSASALTPVQAPSSDLDLDGLGRVAVAGDFDSISLFSFYGQSENVLNTNGSQSLLTRNPDGSWESLGLSDAYIESMCSFVRNGDLHGVVLGGNFTSVEGVESRSVALWDADSGSISPLSGINGKVNALYCDDESGTVYVGGMFQAGNSTNAIAWTTGWTNLPFTGFNGEVKSITKNNAGNIVFGGSFTGLGSVSVSNNTSPIMSDTQVVNLAGGDIGATGTTTTNGFSDPRNIICKTGEDGPGNTWLLADNTGGWWQGLFSFGFNPTKLRLYNTKWQGRGTKSFYFENLDNGGVLNLNYIDVDGQNRSCSNPCPLPQDNSTYQDFYLVPSVGMSQFRIFITEWYGDGGGLAGIEMFQDDLYSFAVNDFNEPQCDGVSSSSSSVVNPPNGFWQQEPNQGVTSSDYLSAYITSESQLDQDPYVVFRPNIEQSGNYSILVYTPGCLLDNTCSTRGSVNFTGTMSSEGAPTTTTITQTNDYDKFDQVYYGYVDADSDSFQPSVTLAPLAGQTLPQTVVAQRMRFDLVDSTGGLNGLFEYNPNKATTSTDFSSSAINKAGTSLDSAAVVNSVLSVGDNIYVAGSFSGSGMNNVMSVAGSAKSLGHGGLNADVNDMYLDGSTLYMGGNFTNTEDNSVQGLNNVCAYNTDNEEWSALGAGVDSVVWNIVPLALNITAGNEENCITINGDFQNVNAFDGSDSFAAEGFAVWVPSKKNWLNNLPNADVSISGKLITETSVPGMQFPLYAGQITSQDLSIGGIAQMFGSGSPYLASMGVKINPSTGPTSSNSKRAINPDNMSDGVYTGHFYEDDNKNVTVIGGHFSASASDGSTVHNLVFISGDQSTVTGATELDTDSTVAAMDVYNNMLFAGGSLSGNVDGNDIAGVIVYDLDTLKIADPQPPALGGDDVIVNAVAVQPDDTAVYVGGSFDSAGSLPCATLCIYDTSTQQWNTALLGLSGTITALMWMSKTSLMIAGDLTHSGQQTKMATYDSKKQTFTPFTKAAGLPGNLTCLTPGSGNYADWWAAGTSDDSSAWLSKFQDDKWQSVDGLGQGTTIRGIQVLSLTSDHDSTNLVSGSEILMVVGNINVPNFGNASAALYNGTDFQPFILTNKDDGSQGTLASIFVSNPSGLLQMGGGALAVGFVVLIGLAIALALIFLIVVAGILIERQRRRREGYVPMQMDKNGNLQRIPPETLLGNLEGGKQDTPKV